jgi:Uma2 family endonuclease
MSAVMNDQLSRHRITVEEYYRMAEVELLAPDARVELIEGEVIDMAPIGSSHGGTAAQLTRLFVWALGEEAHLRVELPIRLDESSEPQPDLAVVLSRDDFYKTRHPTAADTLLIVEVSHSRIQYDREVKVPLYARHGIPEVWIVDVEHGELHVHRSLATGVYSDVSFTANPGVTAITALPGIAVDLSDLFG